MTDTPHEMELVRTHDSGAEEWHCPTCGRRFLLHWPPTYRKIVLEVGDEFAAHVGGKSHPADELLMSTPEEWLGVRPVPRAAEVVLPAAIEDYLRTL